MKRLLIILAIIPLIFTSCTKDPYADFVASTTIVEIGEMVYFTNHSIEASYYEWNFDDGNFSFNLNSNHSWIEPGIYFVSLTAFNDEKSDIAIMEIEVLEAPDPVANFNVSKTFVAVGEEISFTNFSLDANSFLWDFGDGYFSAVLNPSHSWRSPGAYTVALSAYGEDDKTDIALTYIDVDYLLFTNLEITVEEYPEPYYLVGDISVRLYPSVIDWEEEVNMIAEGFTNSEGVVVFSNVEIPFSRRLYVDVWGPYHDNYQLAAEDAGWIETDVLIPNNWNYFTAVVDYYPDGKKAALNRKDLKKMHKEEAIRMEPRIPAERETLNKGNQTVR